MGRINILYYLKQPYPFYLRGKSLLIIGLLVFLMALLFNYFFKPFDNYAPEHKMGFFWISFIHSIIPAIIFLLWLPILLIFPRIDEKWNVQKECIFIIGYLFLVGLGQFLVRDVIYDNPNNWSWGYLFEEIGNTYMVGVLFVFILIPLNFHRLNSLNIKNANSLNLEVLSLAKVPGPMEVFIDTEVKQDNFVLALDRFMYARAVRNYVEIYLKTDIGIEKLVKRISITALEDQLKSSNHIIKTHRSYLVNLQYIENVMGNAQGYKLLLKGAIDIVPVSRNMIPQFESHREAV